MLYRSVAAFLALSALATVPLSPGSARAGDTQIYKTVDADGNVVYTDKAPTRDAPKTSLRVHEPTPDDLARVEKQRQASQASEVQRVKQAVTDSAVRAQQQKEKQVRCESARRQYFSLKDATHIYQRDAQGNRVYLPDDQADATREKARKTMDSECAS
ncbi:MAG TPA: DUF4124 domain-containing protein [Steroidobacteraceae bacterium]|nr:DUF4124 domain-containing protein [Steroidobacteraceae bacterium]